MNKDIGRAVAQEALAELASLGYARLLDSLDVRRTAVVTGSDGRTCNVETWVYWDSEKERTLRGWATVDDGGLSAVAPLTECFTVRPDGTFAE